MSGWRRVFETLKELLIEAHLLVQIFFGLDIEVWWVFCSSHLGHFCRNDDIACKCYTVTWWFIMLVECIYYTIHIWNSSKVTSWLSFALSQSFDDNDKFSMSMLVNDDGSRLWIFFYRNQSFFQTLRCTYLNRSSVCNVTKNVEICF